MLVINVTKAVSLTAFVQIFALTQVYHLTGVQIPSNNQKGLYKNHIQAFIINKIKGNTATTANAS